MVAGFDDLAGALDYPLYIVTAAAGDERAGCLVGFAMQTSIDPQRFLACLSKRNHTYRVATAAPALAVHVVPASQRALAELFGGQTGDELDKFERCEWRPGAHGLPLLEACGSWFVGEIMERFDCGDHVGFLLAPVAASSAQAPPLTFQQAKGITPGHEA